MKANIKVFNRCLALLLCIVMVAALLPDIEVSALLDTPKVSVSRTNSGVKVSWKPITGAVKYRVFRKGPSDTKWRTLKDVSSSTTSYTDGNVKDGTTYKYTVRCVSKDGKTFTSNYNTSGVSIEYWSLGTPSVKVSVTDNGIKISWGAVSGAEMYRVFRKGSSGWATIGFTSGTSFEDTSVSPGTKYTYTVRCCSADKKKFTSDYNHSGVSITFTRNFEITKLESVNGGVYIEWSKSIDTSVTYSIERYTGQDWREIDSTSARKTTDTGADFHDGLANNTKYQYRVSYSVGGSKETTPVKSITYFETPELEDIEVDQGKFTVSWLKVEGAPKYRVFRRLKTTEKWTTLADVTGTTYVDKDVASGLNYYYTVRCINNSGQFISGYEDPGKIADYLGMPTLISTSVENDGIHFKWNTVGGAEKYRIYRKTASSSWTEIDTVLASSITGDVGEYVDTSATSGQTYYYTVDAVKGTRESDKDEKGLACTKLANPELNPKTYNQENGVEIKWKGVDKAVKYRVFRKEASGTVWKKLGDTTGLSFIDTTAVNKGSYVYTVRCVASNGSYASGYDETGVTATFYSTPTLYKATVTAGVTGTGTIDITWKTVEGVKYYSVYRRYARKDGTLTDYVPITTTAENGTYRDTPPGSGVTYYYTVRCSNGSSPISYYSKPGLKIYFLMAPELVTPSRVKGAITVKWKFVDGAKGYNVYRKVPGGSWHTIATISAGTTLTFKDNKNVVSGQKYIYTVRAINGDNMSGYVKAGIEIEAM